MAGDETKATTPETICRGLPAEPLILDGRALTDAGCQLSIAALHDVLDRAWADIRSGAAFGGKSVLSLSEDAFWQPAGYLQRPAEFVGERLGWKLSCLYGVNPNYAGVKVIGANAVNRLHGLARSRSTFILMEKFTMQPIAIVDATALSAARTGTYASLVHRLCLTGRDRITLFLFGAGPIADAVLRSLGFRAAGSIGHVFVRARRLEKAKALQASLSPLLPFEITAVEDNSALAEADYVITATNSAEPVFADHQLRRDACLLSLGGDEVPAETLRRVLRQGHLACDDMATVSRRNSQSLALLFSRSGTTLETVGPHLGVLELSKSKDWQLEPGAPTAVTCVGLPMLDLYVVSALYEKYRATAFGPLPL